MTDLLIYEHTQRSHHALAVVVLAVAVAGVAIAIWADLHPAGAAAMVTGVLFLVLVMLAFSRLTTCVTADDVTVSFTWGWPRRVVPRREIASHAVVRNTWLYGFGLRWIPHGQLWNVWGLDAVELRLENGRRFRIGTDDPLGLDAALSL